MSKLVDKERLALLAKKLDERAKAAVAAEEARAKGEEARIAGLVGANAEAIEAINDAESGILKQAKDYVDEKAGDLQDNIDKKVGVDAYTEKMTALDAADTKHTDDIKANAAAITALQTAMGEGTFGVLDEAVKDLEEADKALQTAIQAAQAAANKAQGEVDAVELRVDAVEEFVKGHSDVERDEKIQANADAIAKEVQDREAAIKGLKETHDSEMDAVEGRVEALEAKFEGENSVDAKIAAAQAAAEAEAARLDGVLKQELQGNIDAKVAQSDYDTKVGALEDEDERIAGLVATEAETARAAEEQLGKDIAAEALRADTEEKRIVGLVEAEATKAREEEGKLQAAIDVINGSGDGSIAKAVATEKERAMGVESGLESRIAANEDNIETIMGTGEGSIKKAIADLVDGAPEATDTLNELAKAIKDNKDVYDGYVAEHAQAMASMKTDLQKEIDDDVKVEADRAVAEEAKIRGEFAAADTALHTTISAEIDADVKEEKERAEGQEAAIRSEMATMKSDLQKEIDDVKVVADELAKQMDPTKDGLAKQIADEVSARSQADQALQAAIDALDAAVNGGKGEAASVTGRVAALEAFVKEHDHTVMEGEIDALQQFVNGHDHSAMEKGISDNAAAIEAEVKEGGARDAAIAAALEAYANEEEVKAMLAAVVNSLGLAIEDNKVKLTLGGVDDVVDLKTVELDMATDADIEEIIAGLDVVEGE